MLAISVILSFTTLSEFLLLLVLQPLVMYNLEPEETFNFLNLKKIM